jgi:exopolysaccharide production protein ExoZ
MLKTTVFEPWHVLASYLFVPARHPTTGAFWPILIPGWSLNYEMLFYLVFAIALAIAGTRRALRFAALALMLLGIMLVGQLTSTRIDVMNFYRNTVLLEFLAGVLVGILCRSGLVRQSQLWLGATAAGFALLWAGSRVGGGFAVVSVAATLIVAGAVFMRPLAHNPVSSLGDASYSLYLTHTLVLSAVGLLWQHWIANTPWWLFVACALLVAVAAACLMYRFFEVPVTAKLKAATSRGRSPDAPTAPVRAS